MAPQDVTKEVTASGMLGHGGAAFPAGRKWAVVKLDDGQPHYLCANADEGEPGTFKDRWILEHAPHLLLESMLIAAYALQVRNAFVYIRGEFDLPYRRLAGARSRRPTRPATSASGILGTDFACDIVVYRGAGSYVCGEASGLLSSIEGKRGYPRNRPPRLTVQGPVPDARRSSTTSRRCPTSPASSRTAPRRSSKVGTAKSPGTQLVSISGHIAAPGVYEVEYGYPLAKFLYEDCGGMLGGREAQVHHPRRHLDQGADRPRRSSRSPTTTRRSTAAGSSLGSGGMIVIAEGTCMVRLLQVMLRFYHHESCGQCTPCREGMGWMHRIIDRIVAGEGRPEDIDRLYAISRWNDGTTICGMGDAAGYATIGILDKYRDEFEYFIEHKRSKLRRQSRGRRHA